MEIIKALLSKNMKSQRKQRGWNQEVLAEKTGYSTGFIKDVERGKSWVSPEAVDKICSALQIKPSDLFHDDSQGELVVKVVPVSKALKKMGSVPDHIYDLAEKYGADHDVWKDIVKAFEIYELHEEQKRQKAKKA